MEEAKESPCADQSARAAQKRDTSNHRNTAGQQRQRLSLYLHTHGSCTTCEARRELDILCPAARVMELRRAGLGIDLIWVDDFSEVGKPHKVGKYILAGGK